MATEWMVHFYSPAMARFFFRVKRSSLDDQLRCFARQTRFYASCVDPVCTQGRLFASANSFGQISRLNRVTKNSETATWHWVASRGGVRLNSPVFPLFAAPLQTCPLSRAHFALELLFPSVLRELHDSFGCRDSFGARACVSAFEGVWTCLLAVVSGEWGVFARMLWIYTLQREYHVQKLVLNLNLFRATTALNYLINFVLLYLVALSWR